MWQIWTVLHNCMVLINPYELLLLNVWSCDIFNLITDFFFFTDPGLTMLFFYVYDRLWVYCILSLNTYCGTDCFPLRWAWISAFDALRSVSSRARNGGRFCPKPRPLRCHAPIDKTLSLHIRPKVIGVHLDVDTSDDAHMRFLNHTLSFFIGLISLVLYRLSL